MVDKLEGLVRPIIGIENRSAQEAFDIMVDRIRSHFAATPANGEQVEREQFAENAKISTPTEDARERVKVLEEALDELVSEDAIYLTGAEKDDEEAYIFVSVAAVKRARTALGNKETDRHG